MRTSSESTWIAEQPTRHLSVNVTNTRSRTYDDIVLHLNSSRHQDLPSLGHLPEPATLKYYECHPRKCHCFLRRLDGGHASWNSHDQSPGKRGRVRLLETHCWGLMGEDGNDSMSELEGEVIGLSSRSSSSSWELTGYTQRSTRQ